MHQDANPTTDAEISDAMCETCGADDCVDLETNPQYCGDCSTQCDTEELCRSSQCFEKAEIVRANLVTADNYPGLVVSSSAYPGWQFEVPNSMAGFTTQEVGFMGSHMGPLFVALIALEGSNDVPDPLDLSGADVFATAVSASTNVQGAEDILFPLAASLSPGWYAIVVGAGEFGSPDNAEGSVWGLQETIAMPQLPFTLLQTNQSIVLQDMQARFFLRGFLREE